MEKQNQFYEHLKKDIIEKLQSTKREGIDKMIDYLNSSDYFEAPASARYHLSRKHGLMEHHWNVFKIMEDKNKKLGIPKESVIIPSLLHDVCKIGLYNGKFGVQYTTNKSVSQRGHAKLSLERISKFIKLTEEEESMIKYHMGTFGIYDYSGNENGEYSAKDMHNAIKKFASVQIFASSDMESSRME